MHIQKLSAWFAGNRAGLLLWALLSGFAAAAAPDTSEARADRGRSLFLREWIPGVPSAPGGDGLGPVYNETSCVACHNQGGMGGAGSADRNVDLISAAVAPDFQGEKGVGNQKEPSAQDLMDLHAGFGESMSVALHRYGIDDRYEPWRLFVLDPRRGVLARRAAGRANVQLHQITGTGTASELALLAEMGMHRAPSPNPTEYCGFTLFHFQRNPISLFGAGWIDAVPDAVIEAAARRRDARFPEISGRVCRLPDGRIGRFGWKAHEARLEGFVLAACAVELGLEVPGRHQAGDPRNGNYRAPGLDMTPDECGHLVAFVGSLPPPDGHPPTTGPDAEAAACGREAFERIGCAACHSPKLGTVGDIYSDLLLHDLGDRLGEIGSYGVAIPERARAPSRHGLVKRSDSASSQEPSGVAASREWRTPPVWGVRDSAPYLHDGRAETLEQAIALHGGEAEATAERYFRLPYGERRGVQAFLKSVGAAPDRRTTEPPGRATPDGLSKP